MIIPGKDSLDVFLPELIGVFDIKKEADKAKYKKRKYGSTRDLYAHYAFDLEKENKKPKFSYREFKEFTMLYNGLLSVFITETGKWIKLPLGLGVIGISKFKPRYYKPKYNPINKTVERQYNDHTEGYVTKLSWIKEKNYVKNITMHRHMATCFLKTKMYEAIMNNSSYKLYYEINKEEENLGKKEDKKRLTKLKYGDITGLEKIIKNS